jgi:hypothetical protein
MKARLIGKLDPETWELPPKSKWMRWRTYNRLAEAIRGIGRDDLPEDSTPLALVAHLSRRPR